MQYSSEGGLFLKLATCLVYLASASVRHWMAWAARPSVRISWVRSYGSRSVVELADQLIRCVFVGDVFEEMG